MSLVGLIAFSFLYCILSFVLLRWPALLHKKNSTAVRATVVCHRGGSGEFIENTIHAFSSAVNLGSDMLELDCQMTADGEVVVSHDNDLLRSTGVDKRISDLKFGELPQYSACIPVTFGFGELCTTLIFISCLTHAYDILRKGKVTCAKEGVSRSIPLLRTVFEHFPRVAINIDVKVDNDELIKKISDMVDEFQRWDITVWGSFSDVVNAKCRKENPRIATFMPIKRTIAYVFAYHFGLLPFLPMPDGFFEVPLMHNFGRMENVKQYIRNMVSRVPAFLKFGYSDDDLLKLVIDACDYLLMSRKMADHLRARGVQVFYWVCNTEHDFDRAFSMGHVAVVTDYPSVLLDYLKKHPEIQCGSRSSEVVRKME